MAIPPIAALEIGSSRTVMCVGEADDSGRVKITGVGTYPTLGVRKGQVVELPQVKAGVEAAARQAEKLADVSIWQVLLAASGGHIQSVANEASQLIRSSDHVVTREDVEEVTENAKDVQIEARSEERRVGKEC